MSVIATFTLPAFEAAIRERTVRGTSADGIAFAMGLQYRAYRATTEGAHRFVTRRGAAATGLSRGRASETRLR